MSLTFLLPVGVAIAQVAIRVWGEPEFADSIGDAKGAISSLRGRKRNDPEVRRIGKIVAVELEACITAEPIGASREHDLNVVAMDVKQLIVELSRNDEAILTLARNPKTARRYLRNYGGDRVIRDAPQHAVGFAYKLLDTTADILARLSPRSERFNRLALVDLLQSVEALRDVPDDTKQTRRLVEEIHDRLLPVPVAEKQLDQSAILQGIHHRRDIVRGLIDGAQGALIPRKSLLEQAFDESLYPMVYLGAGGLGKSVLVGEIADALSSRHKVLIACAAIDSTGQLQEAAHIDEQLGAQATGLVVPLSTALAAFPERPLLIIDTIDILLREETAATICTLLTRWSELADLVVTCRSREWHDLVAAWQRQFTPIEMPSLTEKEILEWSAKFIEHEQVPDEHARRFLKSLADAVNSGNGRNLLGVPLRLAMATRLYAAQGALPPELTVTQLYKSYWDQRVSTGRDGRKNTRAVHAVEEAALRVAHEIWNHSKERFTEDVRFDGDQNACNALLSEGILYQQRYRFQFFHQTFAEFAVARYLGAAADDDDFKRLRDGLLSRRSGYWGIASYLAFEDLFPKRYERVIDSIPVTSVEGVRIIVDSLLARSEHELVQRRLKHLIDESPNHVAAASDLFITTPRAHQAVVADALLRLAAIGSEDFTAVVRALALLIASMPADEGASTLATILNIISTRERNKDPLAASESRRLIDAVFVNGTSREVSLLEVVIADYTYQPTPGQYAIIDAAHRTGVARLQSKLITQAQRRKVPPESVDLLADLLCAEFDDPERRAIRGWETWQEVLSTHLPRRWDAVQARLIAHMADDDAVRNELLDEALAPRSGVPRDILINSLQMVAVRNPRSFAMLLAHSSLPQESAAAHVYAELTAKLGTNLGSEERKLILHALGQIVHLNTRSVWPAMARLSSMDLDSVDALLEQLRTSVTSVGFPVPKVWTRAVEAVTIVFGKNLSPQALDSRFDQLRALWNLAGPIDSAAICSILALVSPLSASARDEFDEIIDSNRTSAHLKGIQTLVTAREKWPQGAWSANLKWIVALIRVRRDGAAIELAQTLRADVSDPRWTSEETSTVVARLIEALEQRHDPQVSRELILLLAAVAHDGTDDSRPTVAQVDLVLERLRQQLSEQAIAADVAYAKSLYAQYVSMITDVAMQLIDLEAVADIVETFALEVDTAAFSSRAGKTLELALSSVLRRNTHWWSRLESMWPQLPEQNRGAVAEVALSGLLPEREIIAERLARRDDCPPDVAADIHRRLRNTAH